jgi:hypothetical protein
MFCQLQRVPSNFLKGFSMKSIKFAAAIAACAFVGSTAYAGDVQSFSALQGVEAQALSSPEMNAVYGQLTIAGIDAAITANVANTTLAASLVASVDAFAAAHPLLTARVLANLTARGF